MNSFRFLHAADIHLDSPVGGLKDYPGPGADRFRTATREAFDRLVDRAIGERVDFLVIAGDLYDGDWKDFGTGLYFVSRMARLHEAGVPVFVLHGNHDAESVLTRRLELPPNVHVFDAGRASTFDLPGLGVALHGRSFPERAVSENLVPDYPEPVKGAFNIGVLHTALEGMSGHARYAPCTLSDLTTKGYDYWALGHVHQAQVLHEHPHVVFPGNLQGRHVRETGPKGVCLVTVHEGEVTALDTVPLDVVRLSRVRVCVEDTADLARLASRTRSALEAAVSAEADGRLLLCRVVLEGRTPLFADLRSARSHLLAEARAAALGLGEHVAWVDRLSIRASPDTPSAQHPAFPDLEDLFADASNDPELASRIQADIGGFARRLPHEIRAGCEDGLLATTLARDVPTLLAELYPDLAARLRA